MSTLRVLIGLLFALNLYRADACTMVSTATVTTPITCHGACDGVVTLVTSGGTAPYVVNDPVSGGLITYLSSYTFTGLCAGTYTFHVTDAGGCDNTVMVTVIEPPAINIFVTSNNPSGAGSSDGSISATVTGGTPPYIYTLNGGTPQTTGNFGGLAAGTYNVCVQDANGCINCETVTLTGACSMVSTVFVTTPISCNGACDGVITLGSTMGTPPYMVNNPFGGSAVTYSSFTTFSGVCAGTYTFLITDAAGCQNLQVLNVTQPAPIDVVISGNNVSSAGSCDGSIIATAIGGTPGPYQYSVDNGITWQGTGTFTGLCAGTYSVCAQDINGCQNCESYTIGVGSCTMVSTVAVTSPITCNGACDGVVTLVTSSGTAPYVVNNPFTGGSLVTYLSSTTFTGVCPGVYTFNINDVAGCNNILVLTVTQPAALNMNTTPSNPSSSGSSDGTISATVTGGTAPYVYTLNGGTPQTTGNFAGLAAGTYNVCVQDANGCTSCETVTLAATGSCSMVSTVFVTTPISCHGACDGIITLGSTLGTPPYMVNNPFGGSAVTYSSFTTFSGVCAGTYTFLITDAAGCENIQVLTVTQPSEILLVNSLIPVSGAGLCDGSIIPTAAGGTPPYQYSIDGGITWGAPPFTGLCQGDYTVCVQDANGCQTCEPADLNSPMGVNELEAARFSLYPNPTTGRITINTNEAGGWVVLTSVMGQTITALPINNTVEIDLDGMGLENGIYFVNYHQNNKVVQTSRIVLSR